MLLGTALRFANHLLTGEQWARMRLKSFAGQTARLEFGRLAFPIAITSAGLLAHGDGNAEASVTITLADDAPLQALTDPPSLLASARIAGAADLAETLSFVFRNLRWNAEDDLAGLIGDIAARRLLQGGRQFAQWHQRVAKSLALNVAEYFTEENPAVARRGDVARYCTAVDVIQDDCSRFEMRVRRLELETR